MVGIVADRLSDVATSVDQLSLLAGETAVRLAEEGLATGDVITTCDRGTGTDERTEDRSVASVSPIGFGTANPERTTDRSAKDRIHVILAVLRAV